MDIEIVISSMKLENIKQFDIGIKNIRSNVLFINQTNNNFKYINNKVRMYNFNERGLSKSRNRGLKISKGDIILLTDDDVVFKDNYENVLLSVFKEYPEVDIITFQIQTPKGKLYKNYNKRKYKHNKRTVLGVSSIEIALRKESIINHNVCFDDRFGLGAKYPTGEENIFLMDCLKKGFNIIYIPIPLVIHPKESSGTKYNRTLFFSKGALFARLFGWKCWLFDLAFCIKKYKNYSKVFQFLEVLSLLFKGSLDYLRSDKNERIGVNNNPIVYF